MRTFVLLLAFTIPPLVACSGAYARSATEMGKPVCARFDDGAKKTPIANPSVLPIKASAIAATSDVVTAPSPNSAQTKGGGSSEEPRPRSAPHWQTFLPGMFR